MCAPTLKPSRCLRPPLRRWSLGLGLSLVAGVPAAPLSPTDYPDLILKLAGSTIWDNNLDQLLAGVNGSNGLCLPGTLSTFRDGDANGKGTYWRAWFCQLDSSKVQGLSQINPKTLILKRNKSGAVTGTYPLLEPSKKIQFMGISNAGQCTLNAGSSRSYQCRTQQVGDLFLDIPDAGMLDVDPALLRNANYIPSFEPGGAVYQPPTPALVAAELEVLNAGAVIQNTPVSLNLRNALQAAQIAEGRLASDCIGKEQAACMPSLSTATLRQLFDGTIRHWSDLTVKTPAGTQPLTNFAQTPLANPVVQICRRNLGASTQAAINAYFLETPCTPSGGTPAALNNADFGPWVFFPGQVSLEEQCLHAISGGRGGLYNPSQSPGWAVGMLTTERNTTLALDYRFIKLDGAAPTPEEVFNGRYRYFSEAAYVYRRNPPRPEGDVRVLIRKIAASASTPELFGALNATIAQPFGFGSFIATSGQGYSAPARFDAQAPITPWTHQPRGQSLDNCRRVSRP